ncbi:signal peptidase I [Latilactobacillus fuchuensis]|uniref:signal peptidase I n=1 Tax=Latilactobacillus fuchuensis TaxID=164393 RepID=UPI0020C759DD|nr:signal peptidase I [Latilactobacillus fuchuensis]MCP8856970.1 signal peptidase I [Latilactobacillus fuchuensis]
MSAKTKEFWKSVLQIILLSAVMIGIAQLLLTFVIANEQIFGPSMQPNFSQYDRVIALRHTKVERGDVVILKAPDAPGEFYIKRVIGLPGDTVRFDKDQLYVNNKKVSEPYLKEYKADYSTYLAGSNYFTVKPNSTDSSFDLKDLLGRSTVPANHYFVMGDNRTVSKDSRYKAVGFISDNSKKYNGIQGVVKLRYWPLTEFKVY